jgi:sulfur-oxidizing protein SoxX
MKTPFTILPALALIASCTTPPAPVSSTQSAKPVVTSAVAIPAFNYDQALANMMQAGFESRGIALIDRLKQDNTNFECSKDTEPDAKLSEAIEKTNLTTIKPPADGVYLGDFKAGEIVAQSGRGNTWTDSATAPNGGNCYNCHQISQTEVSYGSLGPSLYNYGKLRGNSQAIVDYTWGKLNNAKAYNACSGMPRFGHAGILTEKQIKDVMALLLDPASPVNQ